jgi:hypothetical protein
MALSHKTSTADLLLDGYDTVLPQNSVIELRDGSVPAVGSAASGTLIWSYTLADATPWAAASSGSKSKDGTAWTNTAAASGTPTYYRIRNSGTTQWIQGTAGVGSGDINLDGAPTSGQTVTISTFALTLG